MIVAATPQQAIMLSAEGAASFVASIPANHDFLRPLANAGHHDLIDLVMVHDPRTPWPKQMRNTTHPTVFMVWLEATFTEDPELGCRMAEAILQLVSRGPQHMVGFILKSARTLDNWNYVPPTETVMH